MAPHENVLLLQLRCREMLVPRSSTCFGAHLLRYVPSKSKTMDSTMPTTDMPGADILTFMTQVLSKNMTSQTRRPLSVTLMCFKMYCQVLGKTVDSTMLVTDTNLATAHRLSSSDNSLMLHLCCTWC